MFKPALLCLKIDLVPYLVQWVGINTYRTCQNYPYGGGGFDTPVVTYQKLWLGINELWLTFYLLKF